MPTPFDTLIDTYKQMDAAYEAVAEKYGFHCQGCRDNCCTALFFHHTFAEQDYLRRGFQALDPETQAAALDRAREWVAATFRKNGQAQSQKILCPLNMDGRCMTYAHRPMICRLHGLPHEMSRPGVGIIRGKGCDAGQFKDDNYIPFDRTPLYRRMAQAEMEYRQTTGRTGKTKLTIAQILIGE
ncbi:MAG: hypothetical protein MI747_18070 [Desulfobacterales bacterium]|nr:hypothetical protein [Desulfobacterales bacterium]